MLVGKIAPIVTGSAYTRVGHDDRSRSDIEDFVNGGRGEMSEVDDDALLLHLVNRKAPEACEAAFLDAVGGACVCVVEEMCEADHSVASVEEQLEIGWIALHCVGAFDGQQGADDLGAFCARGE